MSTALVIGGTGPTGIHIVQGLVDRGWDVTILHRGTHERPETPAVVRHLHADPYDVDSLSAALAGHRYDLIVAMYGRLRTHRRADRRHDRPVRVGRRRARRSEGG